MAEALCTVAELQAALQRGETALVSGALDEDALQPIIDRVSALCEEHCDRKLLDAGDDETIELVGDGGIYIRLIDEGLYPIISVISVTDDGDTIPQQPDSNSNGWKVNPVWRRRGRIALVGYNTTADAVVSVVARTGYSSDAAALVTAGTLTAAEGREHDNAVAALKQACLDWCVYLIQNHIPGADNVQLGPGMAMSFSERMMPKRVQMALAPYRRITL